MDKVLVQCFCVDHFDSVIHRYCSLRRGEQSARTCHESKVNLRRVVNAQNREHTYRYEVLICSVFITSSIQGCGDSS